MRSKAFIIFTIAFAVATTVVGAQTPNKDIWGHEIMQQLFDKQPFHEVRIPQWLQEITGFNYSVTNLNNYDEAAKCGTQMGEMPFADPAGAYYESKLLKPSPKYKPGEVELQIAEYDKRGMRIVGAIPPCLMGQMYAEHPDWRGIERNTNVIPNVDVKVSPEGGWLCQTGPWGDYMIEVLAEILTKYPQVDAFGFDGIHHRTACYCQHCRDRYRTETGLEIPDINTDDLAFRRYMLWNDRQMEMFVEKIQKRLRSINPDFAIVSWTTNAGRFGHYLDIPRNMSTRMNLLFDAPAQEFWLDETNRGNTVVPAFANAYIWATTNHRVSFSEPYIFSHGNPYTSDGFPAQEMLQRAMLAITNGSNVSLAYGWKGLREAALMTEREVKRRSPWLTHKQTEPWAAVVMSDITRNFYGRQSDKVEQRYLSNVFGIFRTAMEEHLSLTVINDWNLTPADLARYKVLVLANTACLSDAQAEAIRQFVKNGGGLVASVDASLFDELGSRRKNFALADVFGVDYKGLPSDGSKRESLDVNFEKGISADYWDKHKSIFTLTVGQDPMMRTDALEPYLRIEKLGFKGQAVDVLPVADDARIIAQITPRDDASRSYPAIVARLYGKGKVIYLAAGLDSAYYMYPYPHQRLMLAQAMHWAASEPFGIKVKAPMCVQSTFYRQKRNGERLIVHLNNTINSNGNHALPVDDVPLREEIVPIHDIKILFKGYQITRVHLEPEAVTLKTRKTSAGLEVIVPKLAIHSMVVAELAR